MSSAGTTKKVPSVIRTVVPGNRTLDQIYEDEAREIVDEAIENARRRMADYAGEDGREGEAPAQQDQPIIDPETGYEIPNIKWMTADNFTVAGGLEKIEEFIKVISQRKLRLFIAQSFLSQCGSQVTSTTTRYKQLNLFQVYVIYIKILRCISFEKEP